MRALAAAIVTLCSLPGLARARQSELASLPLKTRCSLARLLAQSLANSFEWLKLERNFEHDSVGIAILIDGKRSANLFQDGEKCQFSVTRHFHRAEKILVDVATGETPPRRDTGYVTFWAKKTKSDTYTFHWPFDGGIQGCEGTICYGGGVSGPKYCEVYIDIRLTKTAAEVTRFIVECGRESVNLESQP